MMYYRKHHLMERVGERGSEGGVSSGLKDTEEEEEEVGKKLV